MYVHVYMDVLLSVYVKNKQVKLKCNYGMCMCVGNPSKDRRVLAAYINSHISKYIPFSFSRSVTFLYHLTKPMHF